MKKLLFIVLCSFFLSGLSAQKKTSKPGGNIVRMIKTVVPENSNNAFFGHFPKIDMVRVGYKQYEPVSLSIYFKNDKEKMNSEYYDIGFEVDAYVFRNNYPGLNFPVLPSSVKVSGHEEDSSETGEITGVYIYKDSVEYIRFQICPPAPASRKSIPLGLPAKYKGDINEIAKRIQMYNKRIRDTGDSILVFRGEVDEKGVLSNLELIVGQKSDYSYLIERDLNHIHKSSWIPAKMLARNSAIGTFIRIYIRSNKDGTVTVLTSPRELVTITGR